MPAPNVPAIKPDTETWEPTAFVFGEEAGFGSVGAVRAGGGSTAAPPARKLRPKRPNWKDASLDANPRVRVARSLVLAIRDDIKLDRKLVAAARRRIASSRRSLLIAYEELLNAQSAANGAA